MNSVPQFRYIPSSSKKGLQGRGIAWRERGLGQGLMNHLEIHLTQNAGGGGKFLPSHSNPSIKNAEFSLSLFWSHFLAYI